LENQLLKKLVQTLMLVVASLIAILLLLFLFQPTNVVVEAQGLEDSFFRIFGGVGILLSAPIAMFMVKVDKSVGGSLVAKLFHHIGVWGTRSAIVFMVYMISAISGYLLPKHIIHFNASADFTMDVQLVKFRVENKAYLVIKRPDGKKVRLLVDNILGTNKLAYDGAFLDKLLADSHPYKVEMGTPLRLSGRRHALGYTFDSVDSKNK